MKVLSLRILPWEEANRLPQRIDFIKGNIEKSIDYSEVYIRPIHALGYYLGYIIAFLITIPHLLRRKYNILLLENSYLIVFGFIARLSRRKVIAEYVDYYPSMLMRIWRTRRLRYYVAVMLCSIFSKLANDIVVESKLTKKGVVDLGIPSFKVHVINHSPDSTIMKFHGRQEIRKKYNLSEDAFIVGYLGKIPKHYNLDIIPSAIAIAQALTKRELVFMMVGEGAHLATIKKLTTNLKLKRAIFTGKVPYEEAAKYYSTFDVLLFTIKAPVAIKLIEAMLVGTPIITGSGYATEYIIDNFNGLVAEGGEPEAFANKIVELTTLPKSEIEEMRKRIQKYAYQQFTLSYRNYLQLFQESCKTN
jgi:glycosyltransferase involved in cell wall biosynthesis